jgi:hypothetical protein
MQAAGQPAQPTPGGSVDVVPQPQGVAVVVVVLEQGQLVVVVLQLLGPQVVVVEVVFGSKLVVVVGHAQVVVVQARLSGVTPAPGALEQPE